MTNLIELAAIVEKLTGPDANVNADILRALGWTERGFIAFTPEGNRAMAIPDYLGSLDAASSLIPADSFWRVGHDGDGPDPSLFKAVVSVSKEGEIAITLRMATAETAPLALCAAALRATAYLWLADRARAGKGE